MTEVYLVVQNGYEGIEEIYGARDFFADAIDFYNSLVELCIFDNKRAKEYEGLSLDDPKWDLFKTIRFSYTDPKRLCIKKVTDFSSCDITPNIGKSADLLKDYDFDAILTTFPDPEGLPNE